MLARQAELKALTRKYAADVAGVLAWAEEAQARLAGLDTSEEALAGLAARRDALAGRLAERAEAITAARQASAAELAKAVTDELAGLAMAAAAVDVSVVPQGGRAPATRWRCGSAAADACTRARTVWTMWSCGCGRIRVRRRCRCTRAPPAVSCRG